MNFVIEYWASFKEIILNTFYGKRHEALQNINIVFGWGDFREDGKHREEKLVENRKH